MSTATKSVGAAAVTAKRGYDPVELRRSLAVAAEKSADLIGDFAARQAASGKVVFADELGVGKAFLELAAKIMANPYRMAEAQMTLWWDYMSLWQSSLLKLMGAPGEPVVVPAEGDPRFRHDDWQEYFLFDFIKQSYLITSRWLNDTIASVEGLDPASRRKIDAFTRQYIDALAPSNFALTNPEVFRETIATGGQNLVRGLANLLHDIEHGNVQLRISITDTKAFELGVNIAMTPGKVVFQNDVMQLLQYEPATPKVRRRPLLIVPPWINKYYLLDLRERNSLVRWCVDQGITVFLISWVNPGPEVAHKGFEDYVLEGPIAALEAIERATGEREAHALGYCLGGTMLAATLGYLAGLGEKRIVGATFLATLVDFVRTGESGLVLDESGAAAAGRGLDASDFLDSAELATTFSMLRSNDLIWSFVINNYLMGRDPFPFDLLHWNQDATRIPARTHTYYLRELYAQNKLREPGGIVIGGVPIDLGKVAAPSYFVAAIEDHVAPWRATYGGIRLLHGKSRFVLAGSGRVLGIINPPSAGKYGYWTNDRTPADAEQWFAGASQKPGSWWTDWLAWLEPRLGAQVTPRIPGRAKLPVIEAAPGGYVKMRGER
jgi:polyhydroxyalkanoate synthase